MSQISIEQDEENHDIGVCCHFDAQLRQVIRVVWLCHLSIEHKVIKKNIAKNIFEEPLRLNLIRIIIAYLVIFYFLSLFILGNVELPSNQHGELWSLNSVKANRLFIFSGTLMLITFTANVIKIRPKVFIEIELWNFLRCVRDKFRCRWVEKIVSSSIKFILKQWKKFRNWLFR